MNTESTTAHNICKALLDKAAKQADDGYINKSMQTMKVFDRAIQLLEVHLEYETKNSDTEYLSELAIRLAKEYQETLDHEKAMQPPRYKPTEPENWRYKGTDMPQNITLDPTPSGWEFRSDMTYGEPEGEIHDSVNYPPTKPVDPDDRL